MHYRKFTEYNEHEGEKWNFFLIFRSAEDLDEFNKLVYAINDEEKYTLSNRIYTPDMVRVLIDEEGDTTYMNQYNICGFVEIDLMKDSNDLERDLYKGGIKRFCTSEENNRLYR